MMVPMLPERETRTLSPDTPGGTPVSTAFGPGGVVYLTTRDGMTTTLEKGTIR